MTRAIRLQAVRVSDDDGGRRASVECEQVRRWVDYANDVYKPSGVTFTFDPDKGDFTDLRSTLINSMTKRETPAEAREEVSRARTAALEFSGRMVVFFRAGPAGSGPTGEAFSSPDSAYIIMPGFECTWACEEQNIAALAHEVGHYLGLNHTFVDDYRSKSVADAEARLRSLGGDVQKFDGDGFSDTPPDPGIDDLGCTGLMSVTLNGVEVPLPRGNIMSYLGSKHHSITPQQAARVAWVAQYRLDHGTAGTRNADPDLGGGTVIELEGLPATSVNATTETQRMIDFGWYSWSDGNQML